MKRYDIRVPLDGLGMDEKAMLELVNRMNANDDRKWVLDRGEFGGDQAQLNTLALQQQTEQWGQQALNPAFLQ